MPRGELSDQKAVHFCNDLLNTMKTEFSHIGNNRKLRVCVDNPPMISLKCCACFVECTSAKATSQVFIAYKTKICVV